MASTSAGDGVVHFASPARANGTSAAITAARARVRMEFMADLELGGERDEKRGGRRAGSMEDVCRKLIQSLLDVALTLTKLLDLLNLLNYLGEADRFTGLFQSVYLVLWQIW